MPSEQLPHQSASQTVEQILQQAIAHQRTGKSQEAEGLYRAVLQVQPDNPDANHNLGVLQMQAMQPKAALPYLKAALQFNPTHIQYRASYSAALVQAGQEPDDRDKKVVLECFADQRYAEAAILAQAMTAQYPLHGFGWKALGAALKEMGRCADSLASMQVAADLLPDDAEAQFNLGNTFKELGRLEEAEASYRRTLRIRPGFAEGHNTLGNTLRQLGRLHEAEASSRLTLRIKPDFAEAHNDLGNILLQLGRLREAEASYRQALLIKPLFAEAHNNLGLALHNSGRFDEAEASYRLALKIRPDYAIAHSNLGNTLRELGRLNEAESSYRAALEIRPDFIEAYSNFLFTLNCAHGRHPSEIYAHHREFWRRYCKSLDRPSLDNGRDPERRLRVGYVSADFQNHSVSSFFEPVLAKHDKLGFESFCYYNDSTTDGMTKRLRSHADHWREVSGLDDAALANLIRRDAIDILLDLSGHTARNRLLVFARKPAPVQVTWLGYVATTGLESMDYRLTDGVADPNGETECFHSEILLRLPQNFLCYAAPQFAPEIGASPRLRAGQVTFGCFNQLAKVTPEMIALWSKLLRALPDARLMLKANGLAAATARRDFRDRFADNGIAAERIVLLPPEHSIAGHLEKYREVDIGLDVSPYNGVTTTCEALWMGVPVVTLAGRVHISRAGASLLRAIGLGELVAGSQREYLEICVGLARDIDRLAALRAGLRSRMQESPLMDAESFTRSLESAYRKIWRTWCESQVYEK